jgi:hypothetical protein
MEECPACRPVQQHLGYMKERRLVLMMELRLGCKAETGQR